MLRLVVILLVAANGLYFAWSQGHLQALGWAPHATGEPERLQTQIKPEVLSLLSPKEAKRLEALGQKPAECVQTEVLAATQVKAVREQLQTASSRWPQGMWTLESFTEAGAWIIFMGPYPNETVLDKKKQELRKLSIAFETLQTKTLGNGLSLAISPNKEGLDKQLAALNKQGVRTAKIVASRVPASGIVLKIPNVTDDIRPLLGTLTALLPATEGAPFRKCPPSPTKETP